jgi:hypothetical protein
MRRLCFNRFGELSRLAASEERHCVLGFWYKLRMGHLRTFVSEKSGNAETVKCGSHNDQFWQLSTYGDQPHFPTSRKLSPISWRINKFARTERCQKPWKERTWGGTNSVVQVSLTAGPRSVETELCDDST